MKKVRVGILCGGKSGEHEVSLQSAKNIVEAIDKDKYEVVVIGIDKSGQWSLYDSTSFLVNPDDPKRIGLNTSSNLIYLAPSGQGGRLLSHEKNETPNAIDVLFPVLHGPFGEDGTVQGLIKLANLPFVGASVLGSAVGMDKDVMKRLLRDAGIPIAKFLVFQKFQIDKIDFEYIKDQIGLPFFVKPANYGSSIGITKVEDAGMFSHAIEEAFQFDYKIVLEEFIKGREIECSVLGNEDPIASVPGEIIPEREFYSYEAKYIDENGASLVVPAELETGISTKIKGVALRTFTTLCCEGMARVDIFLTGNNEIIVNEINTIPGFTKISMYPRLWGESGISYTELIDRLIQLAIDRFKRDEGLKVSYT